ncbi:MAG TPA: cytochrome c family protein [Rhodopila sp.]|nr:cytochrome c family protein [Rhodopila sp.]
MTAFPTRAALAVPFGGLLLIAASLPAAAAGDAAAGKSVFQNVCSICHSVNPGQNKIGPSLFGVVGRKTGSVPGYSYSAANEKADITWTEANLDKYLEAPRAMIPGTKMTYGGLKDPEKRANLIAYLATLK